MLCHCIPSDILYTVPDKKIILHKLGCFLHFSLFTEIELAHLSCNLIMASVSFWFWYWFQCICHNNCRLQIFNIWIFGLIKQLNTRKIASSSLVKMMAASSLHKYLIIYYFVVVIHCLLKMSNLKLV